MSDSTKDRRTGGGTVMAGGAPTGTPVAASVPPPPPPGRASGVPGAPVAGGGPTAVAVATSGGVTDLVGSVLSDRYQILSKLGEGGMGTVYVAEHTTINKRLAIKVLSPEYSHKQDLVDRFLQEARAASMIDQENVVEITDFGSTPNGSVFFVMEYLQGEDLAATIRNNGPLPWSRVKPIMLQICDALCAAHEAGIIHRDMKPENCFRIRRGGNEDFIKVLDFGIAKVTNDDGEGGRGLTRTGMIFGTPEYMSPEQAKGERVDHRVDIYAVGVIMYEMLTGRVPFTADTFMGILTKHMFEAPPAPSSILPGVTFEPEIEAIILKALQKDREYRFQTMADLAAAIEAVGTGTAAVSVVAEQVTPPPTKGQTAFSTGELPIGAGPTSSPGTMGPSTLPPAARTGSNIGLFVGGGVFAAALVGLAGWWVLSGRAQPMPPPSANSAAAAIPSTTPAGPPEPETPKPSANNDEANQVKASPVPPAAPAKVTITVETEGVTASLHDGNDDGKIGETNTPIELPYGTDVLDLYVRAEGYEEFLLTFVPDKDKTLTASLAKLRRGKVKRKSRRTRKPKATATAKPTPTKPDPVAKPTTKAPPPPAPRKPPPKPKASSSSPDLKDPFQH